MKKILFIYPNTANTPVIPNGIAILMGIAKSLGFEVKFFDTWAYEKPSDSNLDRQKSGEFKSCDWVLASKSFPVLIVDLQSEIDKFQPDIIAISFMSFEYEFLLSFFRKINIAKDILVMAGGLHSILKPDEVIDTGLFDLVCIGEGEITFKECLLNFDKRELLKDTGNIFFRENRDGAIIKNQRNRLLSEKELWDANPDYSVFDERYFKYPFDGKLYRRFCFEVGRGCPYDCTYCGNSALKKVFRDMGKFVRTRPIESIKENMLAMVDKYNIELFYLEDECFLSHPLDWLKKLSAWYGSEIKKPFIVQTRPETITQEKIDILKSMNAPFFQVSCGVESGSEKILHEVCKRFIEAEKIIQAFDLLHQNNIRSCAFFMLGFPYETREDIWESIKLCRRIRPEVAIVSTFQPMEGQELRDVCIKEGYIKEDEPLTTFTSESILNMPQITSKELLNLRRVFMLYAYLPEEYYPDIEKCERDFSSNQELYQALNSLRWDKEKIRSTATK